MTIEVLRKEFSVCKLNSTPPLPGGCCFFARTDTELSLVCETERVDFETAARENGWRGFRIAGTLDFSLIGILSRVAGTLADRRIPVFCVSTFDTDYVLVKNDRLREALDALSQTGWDIRHI